MAGGDVGGVTQCVDGPSQLPDPVKSDQVKFAVLDGALFPRLRRLLLVGRSENSRLDQES